jgi:hypothetical protein
VLVLLTNGVWAFWPVWTAMWSAQSVPCRLLDVLPVQLSMSLMEAEDVKAVPPVSTVWVEATLAFPVICPASDVPALLRLAMHAQLSMNPMEEDAKYVLLVPTV